MAFLCTPLVKLVLAPVSMPQLFYKNVRNYVKEWESCLGLRILQLINITQAEDFAKAHQRFPNTILF